MKAEDLQSFVPPSLRNSSENFQSFKEMLKGLKKAAYRKFGSSKHSGWLAYYYEFLAKLQYTADILNDVGLNDGLWDHLADYEIVRSSLRYMHRLEFDSFGFYTALNQYPQTAVHGSFLQQNPTDLVHKDEANRLWRSLFSKSDNLHSLNARQFGYESGEYNVSPAVRVLGAVRYLENYVANIFGNGHQQELITFQENLLSGGGTFGMNFNRTANQAEAQIMIHNLVSFARRVMDAEQIINSLFSYSITSPILRAKLDDHQINCAIFALSELPDFSDKARKLVHKGFPGPLLLGSNEFCEADISLPDFAKIDEFLRAKHPRMKDKIINSKMRYLHLQSFAGIYRCFDYD